MNKFNTFGRFFNSLEKSKFNSSFKELALRQLVVERVGVRPIVLSDDFEQIAILENAYDIFLNQEVQGIDELSFCIAYDDENYNFVKNEVMIQMFDTVYIIREINVNKSTLVADIFCEAIWYDIAYGEPLETYDWSGKNVREILSDILKTSGWRVGKVDDFRHSSLHLDTDTNRLSAIRKLETKVGGELIFDTQNKIVSLVKENIVHTGASIMHDKNADNIQANYDTRELVTKIYPYGKEGLTIAEANNGLNFLENYSYTKKVRVQVISDERYTNPYELKEMCERALVELSKPRASYTITMKDISEMSGLEHEKFFIGGLVRVYDKELGLDVTTRIMKWKYNVSDPANSDMNLEYKAKSISELLTGVDNGTTQFESETSSDNVGNLSVYNHLLNSRAEDGFAYWSNTGFEVDSSSGSSGNSSFKAVGSIDLKKKLSQKVYPANNDYYTISFKGETKDLIQTGETKIGIEVVINYEDGTSETQFVSLI